MIKTKIINLEKFKEQCAKYDKPELKALLWDLALQRVLYKLVLVSALNSCKSTGEAKSKAETLEDLGSNVEGERILIGLLGRREAAKVYGSLADVRSDVEAVDYVLTNDFVAYYKKFVN